MDLNFDKEHLLAIQISHPKCIELPKIQQKFNVDALETNCDFATPQADFQVLFWFPFTTRTELINMDLVCLDVFFICRLVGLYTDASLLAKTNAYI